MDRLTAFKLGLGFAAIALFGLSIRLGNDTFRWVSIALLVVAVLLRFARPRSR